MLNGGFSDAFVIDSPAIILHFDINVIAAMIRAYGDVAMIGLPGMVPFLGALQSVSNGVADEMNEGIGNLLDDAVVELRFGSREIQLHLLACGAGGIAHSARDPGIQIADWHHARLSDFIL